MKKISIIILTICLSSCSLYKNYSRHQDLKTYGIINVSISRNKDTTQYITWSKIFSDTCLQTIIKQGLANNADLKVAQLQSTEAEASLKASKWAFAPSFSLAPQGTLSEIINGTSNASTYEIPVSASWQVDVFGSLHNAKRRAEAQLESSKAYTQAVQTQLIANIASYYYTIVLLDKELVVYKETTDNWKKNVEVTKHLKEAGQYTEAAVAQATANYYDICTSVIDIEQQIRETENNLRLLLGDTLSQIVRDTSDNNHISNYFINGIPLQLLSQRPDVRQSEQTLASYYYAVNEAKSAFYPSISLSGALGWTNSSGGMILDPAKWIWSAVGSLTQPIFQQGKLHSKLKIAEAQQEEAKLNFQQTLLKAGIEVNNALTQVQTYNNKEVYYERQIESLNSAVHSTTLLMQHGSSTYLEVLTAQQSLLSAKLTQLSNWYNKIIATVNLYQALGIGVEN